MNYICNDCPRKCNIERTASAPSGVCRSPSLPVIARAGLHFGEEPCISGSRGSGAVFFSGCNLRCVFCQNHEISRGEFGRVTDIAHFRDILLRLAAQGAHNINLVTPTHYSSFIIEALTDFDPGVPIVWNSSGYESVETLKRLEGLVQIYMPDLKYLKRQPAQAYSKAPDYPERATEAIKEMFRQTGPYTIDSDGIMQRGVLIRHLILPGQELNSMDVIDFVAEEFPPQSVLFSLMSQYTPMPGCDMYPELAQRVDAETNDNLIYYLQRRGISDGYWQETDSATDEMIPDFDLSGL